MYSFDNICAGASGSQSDVHLGYRALQQSGDDRAVAPVAGPHLGRHHHCLRRQSGRESPESELQQLLPCARAFERQRIQCPLTGLLYALILCET
jgi:hypothetical protein